jgi:hypothetical protein
MHLHLNDNLFRHLTHAQQLGAVVGKHHRSIAPCVSAAKTETYLEVCRTLDCTAHDTLELNHVRWVAVAVSNHVAAVFTAECGASLLYHSAASIRASAQTTGGR